MGNFYVSHVVQTTDRESMGNLLTGRNAFISPVHNGTVVVYDKEADTQDEEIIVDLAKLLSSKENTVVLATLNHDDDILAYWLFNRGIQIDAYNSMPDYFADTAVPRGPIGGDAKILCESFGSQSAEAVEQMLRSEDYVFALDRHIDLVRALGLLPEFSYMGYRHLAAGELSDGFEKSDFIELGVNS